MKNLTTALTICFLLLFSLTLKAQNNALVIKGAFIVMKGGTEAQNINLVVNESSTSGIVRLKDGGHIHSENQYSNVKWKSNNSLGSYVFPFGIKGNTKDYIPFTFNKTAGKGSITMSTWGTNKLNSPKPQGVSSMSGKADAALYLVDRFWDIQAPGNTADLTFSYLGAENTTTEPNNNLLAQHWNGTDWDAHSGTGTGVTSGVGVAGPYTGQNTFSPWAISICVPDAVTQKLTICEGSSVIVGKSKYTKTGEYKDKLTNSLGCDSIVTTILTVNSHSKGVDTQVACEKYRWIDGKTYTSNNKTAQFTLKNAAGCDSIVTLNLTINSHSKGVDTQVACEKYRWIDGKTYTSDNKTAQFTLKNAAGCDSIVTLNLTINSHSKGVDTQVACEKYRWIDGKTYTSDNNTAQFTLKNAAGCDSIVTLNLTINKPDIVTQELTICEGSSITVGKNKYSKPGKYEDKLINALGCDSIITTVLTVNSHSKGIDTQVACDSYKWIDGKTYTSDNNTAQFTLKNAAGCDSIVTLNLTINTVDATTTTAGETITANAGTPATYQWIDCNNGNSIIAGETGQSFTATSNGNYAVIVTENNCTDTSACVNIKTIGVEAYKLQNTISVYPNPANEKVNVEIDKLDPATQFKLIDNLGKIVYKIKPTGNLSIIDVQYLPKGVYTLVISTENNTVNKKIIKQ